MEQSDLYKKFVTCNISYDHNYEVENYPITIEEQKEWADDNGCSVADADDKSCFIKIYDENKGTCNVVATMVNRQTTADKYATYKTYFKQNNEENAKKCDGENK